MAVMKDLVAGIPRYRHFINGQWADSTGKEFLEVENPATQEIIGHFSDLLEQITDAADDHSVSNQEADEIRQCWDRLKSHAEGFVRACEAGDFKVMRRMA